MEDETINDISETPTERNYGEALAEIKRNSVPKERYEKLERENRELMQAIIDGQTVEAPAAEEKVDVDAIRAEMFTKDLTNLDYIKDALALREALISKGEPDPFLPIGKNISPTTDDVAAAERVADCLRYCVDVSNDDPTAFNAALQSKLVDPKELQILMNSRNKKGKR